MSYLLVTSTASNEPTSSCIDNPAKVGSDGVTVRSNPIPFESDVTGSFSGCGDSSRPFGSRRLGERENGVALAIHNPYIPVKAW